MNRYGQKLGYSVAEKSALMIVKVLSNLNLDLEATGSYFARIAPRLVYNRFIVFADSAEAEANGIELEKTEINYVR